MVVRTATSDPKPSSRNPGFWYFYYNKRTAAGSECVALIPDSIRDLIRKGFPFDDGALRYNEDLKASVLELDFDESSAPQEPSLPPDPERGWSDHDSPVAQGSADPEALAAVSQHIQHHAPQIPNRGVRPATARKREAAEFAAQHNIPMSFLQRIEWLCAAQAYAAKRLGVTEKPRPMDVQKLVTSAYIDWCREGGAEFSDAEERAMRF